MDAVQKNGHPKLCPSAVREGAKKSVRHVQNPWRPEDLHSPNPILRWRHPNPSGWASSRPEGRGPTWHCKTICGLHFLKSFAVFVFFFLAQGRARRETGRDGFEFGVPRFGFGVWGLGLKAWGHQPAPLLRDFQIRQQEKNNGVVHRLEATSVAGGWVTDPGTARNLWWVGYRFSKVQNLWWVGYRLSNRKEPLVGWLQTQQQPEHLVGGLQTRQQPEPLVGGS